MNMPFKGTTEECLKHFVQTYKIIGEPDKKDVSARNAIAHLFGIHKDTGWEWFNKFNVPKGYNLLRLQYLLEMSGYEILERQGMPELTREFSHQVALGVVKVRDASAHIRVRSSTIHGMLMRCENPGKHETQLEELVNLNREKAVKKLRKWRSTLRKIGVPQPVITNAVSRPQLSDLMPQISSLKDEQIVETVAHLILATLPMAERVLSDDFSPADRSRLRELTTNGRSNAVFDLSNVLNRLCGERARKELL